ncbi:hypothetical protein [Roseateles sp. P5_E1]
MTFSAKLLVEHGFVEASWLGVAPALETADGLKEQSLHKARAHRLALSPLDQQAGMCGAQREGDAGVLARKQAGALRRGNARRRGSRASGVQRGSFGPEGSCGLVNFVAASV